MNSRTILGVSLAAIFAIAMTMTPAFAASSGFLTIKSSSVTTADSNQMVKITTKTAIPTNGKAGAFGYGIIGDTGILVITSHGGVGPDSPAQDSIADPVLHTHIVTLGTNSACVSPSNPAGTSVATITTDESHTYPVDVDGNKLTVTSVPTSAVTLTGPAVSFTLSVVGNPASPTAVCVNSVQVFS